jgi:membrane protein YqaA with SNARE-associated domain
MLNSYQTLLAMSMGWLLRLGGPGLILIGIADNSVVPLTGSMDVLTIWLAASHRESWLYYAFMATAGAVLGGYLTYYLSQKGGKEAIESKFSKRKSDRICARFEKWGFGAVFIPALLPPPFPLVPFLVAAGALQYSRKKFLAALISGRAIRYCIVAGLGAYYGKPIVSFFSQYYKPAVLTLVGLAAAGSVVTILSYLGRNKKNAAPIARRKTA